jgi:antitoxin component YwqK of YwqJK toxin-antitoxin module
MEITQKPKITKYSTIDLVYQEEYYLGNKRHRDGDLPAYICYFDNGKISREEYFVNGELHRGDNKPAVISYYFSGEICSERYFVNGQSHRDGGKPAYVDYYLNGKISFSVYLIDNVVMTNKQVNEFKKFEKLIKNDKSLIILNHKHINPLIQNYCQRELLCMKSI